MSNYMKNGNDAPKKNVPIGAYSVYTKDSNILKVSSSGGVFTELARKIIEQDGVVAGACLDGIKVKHIIVDNENDLSKLRGSKYLQSDIGDIYKEVKRYADGGIKVLFSGVPCQVAALNKYLGNTYSNVYTVDVVCHGTPVFSTFEKSIKDRFVGKELKDIDFRNKQNGWNKFNIKYIFTDGTTVINKFTQDEWFMGFLKNKYLRECCYNCKFNQIPRQGDISLADFWGIENIDKKFFKENKDRGVSLVLINSDRGRELFNDIKANVIFKKQELDKAVIYNPRVITGKYDKKYIEERKKYFEQQQDVSFKTVRFTIAEKKSILGRLKKVINKISKRISKDS